MRAHPARRPPPGCLGAPRPRSPSACQGMPARARASICSLTQSCGSIGAASSPAVRGLHHDFSHTPTRYRYRRGGRHRRRAGPTLRRAGVAGPVAGKPKKLCKQCGFQFTRTTPRGKPLTMRINAALWYLSGVSMHRIAFLLQVSAQAVLNWIRAFATAHPEKPEPTREPSSSRWMRCGTT
jgi:transposase-like protein